jgi:hypothetical protein
VGYDSAGAGDLEFERLWLPLKGISIKKLHRQIVLPYSYNNHTKNIGVLQGSFFAPVVSLTPLAPKSAISKSNIFANSKPYLKKGFQGPRWDSLVKKNRGRKSRDTVPRNKHAPITSLHSLENYNL